MFNFNEKVVMIAGAAGGIGLEISKLFSDLGAKLILIDKRGFKNIREQDYNFPIIFNIDLTNGENIAKSVKEVKKKFGRIDILINCIGVNVRKKIDEYTNEEWDWMLTVNLRTIFNLTNKVTNIMKKNNYGRIINLSSIQAVTCWNGMGRFSLAPYGASKSALVSLTKSFALDLAKFNITVNAVLPAFVDTPLIKNLKEDKELYKDILMRTPIGRLATPLEVANAVVFLAAAESSYITGHALLVDGGWTIQ